MRILLFSLGSILIGSVLPLRAQAPDATSVSFPELSNYPEPHCTKPQVSLVGPTTLNDQFGSVGQYSARVAKFNRDFKAYSACMHAYIDKANMDAKRIQEVAQRILNRSPSAQTFQRKLSRTRPLKPPQRSKA